MAVTRKDADDGGVGREFYSASHDGAPVGGFLYNVNYIVIVRRPWLHVLSYDMIPIDTHTMPYATQTRIDTPVRCAPVVILIDVN